MSEINISNHSPEVEPTGTELPYRPSMTTRYLCCLAYVALSGLVIYGVDPDPPENWISIGIVWGTFLGQSAIASIWACCGCGRYLRRAILALSWVTLLSTVLALAHYRAGYGDILPDIVLLLSFTIGEFCLVQLLLGAMRLWKGIKFADGLNPVYPHSPIRFGISQLMVTTGIAAGLVAIAQYLHSHIDFDQFMNDEFPVIFGTALSVAIIVSALSIAILIQKRIPLALVMAVLTTLVIAVVQIWLCPFELLTIILAIDFFALLHAILFFTILRFFGYRLVVPQPALATNAKAQTAIEASTTNVQ